MRTHIAILCAVLAAAGCKKSGGSGGWLVGSNGTMANVRSDGSLGAGYHPASSAQLNGIACRYLGEAWVVGDAGTLLYTNDGGASWSAQAVPTTANLRTLATQDSGPVFVAGDGVFLTSNDTGAHWTSVGDGQTAFRSVAAAQEASNVLALSDDGALWSYDGALTQRATLAGARAVAISPDGTLAIAAGHGLARSLDGGATWSPLAVDASLVFDDVRIGEDGSAVAVGAGGAIATIDADGHVAVQHAGTADLHTVHIADGDDDDATGFAAGDSGEVLLTHDGGASWQLGTNVGATVWGVDMIGAGHR
ncbi:MAG TPA: YCF48-related protein [Kofleriaceae bacterium]|nr:YCF48-related protein [Kofleriaceae bacterium]